MEKDIIKNVFEKVMKIDAEAEAHIQEANDKLAESDVRIKRRYRSLELEIMKEARVKVKDEFTEKLAIAEQKEADINKKTADYVKRVHDFYESEKDKLVDSLFNDIFGMDG